MILTAAAALFSFAAMAQEQADYIHEVGLYAGIAPFSKPNNTLYRGDKNKLAYTFAINGYHNFNERIQAGLDVGVTHWESNGSYNVNGLMGASAGSRDIKYLYADRVWNVCARFNYVIPRYDEYHVNRSNVYFGVAAGALFTVNDKGSNYEQYLQQDGEQFRYVSQYNYDYGVGYTFGVQVGYNYYFANRWALNVEAAPRYNYVNIVDHRNGTASGQLQVFSYPITVGLKFRF